MRMIGLLALAFSLQFTARIACPADPPNAADSPPTPASRRAKKERPYGIEKRVAWATSRITGSPEPPLPYQVERVFGKLKFDNPVVLTSAPGSNRLFMVQLDGKIFSFANKPDVEQPDLAVDLGKAIKGLTRVFGLTFHPDFENNHYCYICYILKSGRPDGTRVSRFMVANTDPPLLLPGSEKIVMTWRSGGHNGGCLKFGPDGYLYVSSGDGGPPTPPDTGRTGQNIGDLLASVLRIDVDHPDAGRAYSIPPDNPFVGLKGARGEIWAYGLRNPWKMSFDPVLGTLWVGDVGWELWEMIYRIERGGNYGWSVVEGRQPVYQERKRGPTPILPPTVEHSHIEARSITGGYVYRGTRMKELVGAYVYGDYVTGKIWAARHDGRKVSSVEELADTLLHIVCFGVDNAGELYVVGYGGTIHRLIANPITGVNIKFPTKLSRTGLFASVKDHVPAAGVISYSINAELWADGAVAERFLALPGTRKLGVHQAENPQMGYLKGAWKYPSDAVLVKTISMEMERGNPQSLRRLETQVLHYDVDTWRGYTYVWNDEQTDATLADARGFDRTLAVIDPQAAGGRRRQTWHFPSRTECIVCHTARGGSIYSFIIPQLNKDHNYGAVADNQLRTLSHIGLFAEPLPGKGKKKGKKNGKRGNRKLPVLPSPYDESADLNDRVRSYLHVNCAHCHLRGGGGSAAIDVRRKLPLKKTNLLNSRPTQGTFGIHGAQVVAMGDPYRSVLYYRISKLGRGRMPYFGSTVVDERGLRLIHDWISQLSSDPAKQSPDQSTVGLRARQLGALEKLRNPAGADVSSRAASIDELLASTSGALMLLRGIDEGSFKSPVPELIIGRATTHADIGIRDLFERFVPEEKRIKRLGSVVKPIDILALEGNADRGKQVFFNTAGVSCQNCHRIGNQGKQLGPDLGLIVGKQNRAQLLESILEPSKKIDPKFVSYLVETKQGRVQTGLLAKKTAAEIVLKDATGKEIRIPASDVELMVQQRKSLMPELLLRDMTAQQVADLLEYLTSFKDEAILNGKEKRKREQTSAVDRSVQPSPPSPKTVSPAVSKTADAVTRDVSHVFWWIVASVVGVFGATVAAIAFAGWRLGTILNEE